MIYLGVFLLSLNNEEIKYLYKQNKCCSSDRQCRLTEINYVSYTCDQLSRSYKNASCCTDVCNVEFNTCENCKLRDIQSPQLPPSCSDTCKSYITPKCVANDSFMVQRDVAFRCLEKYASKTEDFGTRHVKKDDGTSRWDEYNPTQYCIDNKYKFLVWTISNQGQEV